MDNSKRKSSYEVSTFRDFIIQLSNESLEFLQKKYDGTINCVAHEAMLEEDESEKSKAHLKEKYNHYKFILKLIEERLQKNVKIDIS